MCHATEGSREKTDMFTVVSFKLESNRQDGTNKGRGIVRPLHLIRRRNTCNRECVVGSHGLVVVRVVVCGICTLMLGPPIYLSTYLMCLYLLVRETALYRLKVEHPPHDV